MSKLRISTGIVCALPRELQPLIAHPPEGCTIVAGGVGAAAAERAARGLGGVQLLISAGYAGGIAAPAERGVIVVDTVLDAPPAIRGRIADSQTMVSTREARAKLAATGAIAVDMESAAVARVAREMGVPFAAIRAVTDGPDDDLVIDWDRFRRPDGSMRTTAAVLSALVKPRGMAELLRLWYASNEATGALCAYLTQFLDHWKQHGPI